VGRRATNLNLFSGGAAAAVATSVSASLPNLFAFANYNRKQTVTIFYLLFKVLSYLCDV